MGLHYCKKRPCPKYSEEQLATVKRAAGRLYRECLAKRPFPICIMDDESYIDLDGYVKHIASKDITRTILIQLQRQ